MAALATELGMGVAKEFFQSLLGIMVLCPQSQARHSKIPIAVFAESK
jgi:hypothetical protein